MRSGKDELGDGASLLGSLDAAVNIDVLVLVLDWACRRSPASTYWLNCAGSLRIAELGLTGRCRHLGKRGRS